MSGPLRLPAGHDAIWRLLLAAFIGCFVWLETSAVYEKAVGPTGPTAATAPAAEETHPPRDWAFLSTVPFALGFAATLLADAAMLGRAGLASLGLSRTILRGLATGLLGIVIAFPLVFFVSEITDDIFQSIHYTHPEEHELLKVMDQSGQGPVRMMLIFGAVILAPLFEETLFRGHVQTFFRELFCRLSAPPVSARGFQVLTNLQGITPSPGTPGSITPSVAAATEGWGEGDLEQRTPLMPQAALTPTLSQSTGRGSEETGSAAASHLDYMKPSASPSTVGWQTWLAIVLTSALFALVHPNWMRPTIFFLAICLGYAYERSGSLWTNIVMHAIFNAVNTYLFLNMGH